jgi:peptidoglycan hydrolase-like protein with peptidoglycan-binding domain
MTVTDIQRRLKELGIYAGAVDGISGKQTVAAIRAFQRVHGLRVDGIAGAKTLAELFPAPIPDRDVAVPGVPLMQDETPRWPRQADVEKVFGPVGQHQTMLELPYPMRLAWDQRQPITRFSIHEKVHDSAARCFARIADAYDATGRKLIGADLFGGCLNVRKMRGGSAWSMHSWGIAIDFDPARNQLRWSRDKARLALPDCSTFWRIWEEEGWLSLGRARNYDWMHVQAARL